MATSKREDSAAPKTTTRRRSTSASPEAGSASAAGTQHANSPDVTEAKPPTSARATAPQTLPVSETPRNAEEEIRRRAYELYEQDGHQHGRDRDHWLRAETEVLGTTNLGRSGDVRASDLRTGDSRTADRAGDRNSDREDRQKSA